MEIRQIRFFVEVARAGSFSSAALKLGVAQPLLSRQVRRLEDQVGTLLFHRDGRGAQLTAAGEIFREYAITMVEAADQARGELGLLVNTPTGTAVVGMPPSAGRVLSVPLAKAFADRYPRIALRVVEGFSGHVLEWLQSGQIDIALLYNATMRPGLIAEPVLDEDLYCFGHPADLELIGGLEGDVRFSRVAEHPLVLPSPPHGLRIFIDRKAQSCGLRLRVSLEVDALHTTFEAARARIGLAIMPRSAMADELLAGTLAVRRIVDPVLIRTLYLSTGPKRPSFASPGRLIQLMKAVIANSLAAGHWRLP